MSHRERQLSDFVNSSPDERERECADLPDRAIDRQLATHREAPSCNGSLKESQKLTASDTVETPSIHVDPSTGMSWVTLEDYNNLHERLDGVCEEMAKIAVIVGRSKDGTGLDVDWFELADDVKSHREEAPRQKLTGDAAGETPRTDAAEFDWSIIQGREYKTKRVVSAGFARQLERETSELKAQLEGFRWIPVSERLPKPFETVAVLNDGVERTAGFMGDKEWHLHPASQAKVTHWMPLPKPPDSALHHDT
jgi:hypothetical protein